MNFDDLEKTLRTRPEGAPTDLELDRWVTGQLGEAAVAELEARVAHFPETAARLQLLREQAAAPDATRSAILDNLRHGLQRPRPSTASRGQASGVTRLWSWLRSLILIVPAVTAAAVGLWVVQRQAPESAAVPGQVALHTSPGDRVRSKGGVKLEVMRRRGSQAERTLSGASFYAGDQLRFVVSLATPARVTIVGVERRGVLYRAWPPPRQQANQELPAGPNQALPGAVVLDDTRGRELLYLVTCPPGVEAACRMEDGARRPSCAQGCELTPFELHKE